MKKFVKSRGHGFTIIEVMIVLAIAALILLVVFLAVPNLQRSQKNNARKSDASRMAAAVVDFTSTNSTGSLPSSFNDCTTLVQATTSLSQFTFTTPCVAANAAATMAALSMSSNNLYIVANASGGTIPAIPAGTTGVMILADQAQCPASIVPGTTAFAAGSNPKQAALLYNLQTGTGFNWGCVNPQ